MAKDYKLFRSRRRTLALIVNSEAELVVRAPLNMPQRSIDRFVTEKSAWIEQKLEFMAAKKTQARKDFEPGEEFLYLGKAYELRFVESEEPVLFDDAFLISAQYRRHVKLLLANWYKNEARRVIAERAEIFAAKMGTTFTGLAITQARQRWGSCTAQNKLNFSWRLVMAPLEVVDYVVVHELAHTKVKDHSRDYWAVVAQILPDYKERRAWLREHGLALAIF